MNLEFLYIFWHHFKIFFQPFVVKNLSNVSHIVQIEYTLSNLISSKMTNNNTSTPFKNMSCDMKYIGENDIHVLLVRDLLI